MLTFAVIVLAVANVCWLILFLCFARSIIHLTRAIDLHQISLDALVADRDTHDRGKMADATDMTARSALASAQNISDMARAAESHLADHALERSAHARPQ